MRQVIPCSCGHIPAAAPSLGQLSSLFAALLLPPCLGHVFEARANLVPSSQEGRQGDQTRVDSVQPTDVQDCWGIAFLDATFLSAGRLNSPQGVVAAHELHTSTYMVHRPEACAALFGRRRTRTARMRVHNSTYLYYLTGKKEKP